jgi:hypothetical protein
MNRVSGGLSYLYGIKRYLTEHVITIMTNCNIHSIMDYGIETWAIMPSDQLNLIQKKVDSFICTYYLPIICKKAKRHKMTRGQVKINLNDVRTKLNLFTIEERRDFFLLKHAYRNYIRNYSERSERSRNWPLMEVIRYNTTFCQKNTNFRSIKLWNSLPQKWTFKEKGKVMPYSTFTDKCKELIIEKRGKDFVFY